MDCEDDSGYSSQSIGSSNLDSASVDDREIRLKVDDTAPLSLQFDGAMEGRTMQINTAEGGIPRRVIKLDKAVRWDDTSWDDTKSSSSKYSKDSKDSKDSKGSKDSGYASDDRGRRVSRKNTAITEINVASSDARRLRRRETRYNSPQRKTLNKPDSVLSRQPEEHRREIRIAECTDPSCTHCGQDVTIRRTQPSYTENGASASVQTAKKDRRRSLSTSSRPRGYSDHSPTHWHPAMPSTPLAFYPSPHHQDPSPPYANGPPPSRSAYMNNQRLYPTSTPSPHIWQHGQITQPQTSPDYRVPALPPRLMMHTSPYEHLKRPIPEQSVRTGMREPSLVLQDNSDRPSVRYSSTPSNVVVYSYPSSSEYDSSEDEADTRAVKRDVLRIATGAQSPWTGALSSQAPKPSRPSPAPPREPLAPSMGSAQSMSSTDSGYKSGSQDGPIFDPWDHRYPHPLPINTDASGRLVLLSGTKRQLDYERDAILRRESVRDRNRQPLVMNSIVSENPAVVLKTLENRTEEQEKMHAQAIEKSRSGENRKLEDREPVRAKSIQEEREWGLGKKREFDRERTHVENEVKRMQELKEERKREKETEKKRSDFGRKEKMGTLERKDTVGNISEQKVEERESNEQDKHQQDIPVETDKLRRADRFGERPSRKLDIYEAKDRAKTGREQLLINQQEQKQHVVDQTIKQEKTMSKPSSPSPASITSATKTKPTEPSKKKDNPSNTLRMEREKQLESPSLPETTSMKVTASTSDSRAHRDKADVPAKELVLLPKSNKTGMLEVSNTACSSTISIGPISGESCGGSSAGDTAEGQSFNDSDEDTNEVSDSCEVSVQGALKTAMNVVKGLLLRELLDYALPEATDATGGSRTSSSGSSVGSAGSSVSSNVSLRTPTSQTPKRRKRTRDNGRDPEDGDGNSSDDDDRPRKKNEKGSPDRLPHRRLKCPFFQRQPEKYTKAACRGEGFADIAKVKDHIKRVHTQPLRCSRCWLEMKSEDAYSDHLQQDDVCEKKPQPEDDRIRPQLLKQLDFKKAPYAGARNAEEKWNLLFTVLFPNDANIPSACKSDLPMPNPFCC